MEAKNLFQDERGGYYTQYEQHADHDQYVGACDCEWVVFVFLHARSLSEFRLGPNSKIKKK